MLDFTLQSKCLQVQYFSEGHTANNLAVTLSDAITMWIKTPTPRSEVAHPSDQTDQAAVPIPIYIASDNVANIVAALKQLPLYNPCFTHLAALPKQIH